MVNKRLYISLLLSLTLLLFTALQASSEQFKSTGTIDVFFSPAGGATEAIVKEIAASQSEILVQAFSFTSSPIAQALVAARKRGIKVEVILDKSQQSEKYTSADYIAHAGIPTFIDSEHAIAHNKVIILDKKVLITGSFNFSKSAEMKNAENLLIIKGNEALVSRYVRNYEEHKDHSEAYVGK